MVRERGLALDQLDGREARHRDRRGRDGERADQPGAVLGTPRRRRQLRRRDRVHLPRAPAGAASSPARSHSTRIAWPRWCAPGATSCGPRPSSSTRRSSPSRRSAPTSRPARSCSSATPATDQAAADAAIAPLLALPGAGASTIVPKRYSEVLEDATPPPPGTIVGENGVRARLQRSPRSTRCSPLATAMLPSVLMIRALGGAFSRVPIRRDRVPAPRRRGVDLRRQHPAAGRGRRGDRGEARALGRGVASTSPAPTATSGRTRMPAIVGRMYPGSTYERLAAVKREWDPQNVFRVNHNVAVPA